MEDRRIELSCLDIIHEQVSYDFYNMHVYMLLILTNLRRTCGSLRDSAGPDECGGLLLPLPIRENMT